MVDLIVKPCHFCGVPVKDLNDPTFKDPWSCYFCHLVNDGKLNPTNVESVKSVINNLSLATKYLMKFDYSEEADVQRQKDMVNYG